jgi:UDP-N-acetylglucosamine 2-epimerase (non-hydrolysing)
MCVASTSLEDVEMAALLCALKGRTEHPPLLHVRIGHATEFSPNDTFFERLGLDLPVIHLGIDEPVPTQQLASVLLRFTPLIAEHAPSAIAVAGGSDSALACSLAATKSGTRLVHVGAGVRNRLNGHGPSPNDLLIDRLSQAFYAFENSAYLTLIREGVDEARVQWVGPLILDATRLADAGSIPAGRALQMAGVRAPLADGGRGYGLVVLEQALLHGDTASVATLMSSLHELTGDVDLVWPMPQAVQSRLDALGLRQRVEHERVSVVGPVTFEQRVALLKGASMLVTDCAEVRLQANSLGVRCFMVDMHREGAVAKSGVMPLDGQAGDRIAEHLAPWLSSAVAVHAA